MAGCHVGFMALFWILALCVFLSNATYVVMQEGASRCFYTEVPQDTLIVGEFRSSPLTQPHLLGSSRGPTQGTEEEFKNAFLNKRDLGITVFVTGPHNEEPIHNRAYDPTGHFAFTSHHPGDHKICFGTNSTYWFHPLIFKFQFSIHTGVQATDYDTIAKQDHLSSIEVQIRKLYDRSQEIRAEMIYQKEKEGEFRTTSENTNSGAAWWSIFQICIILTAATLQIFYYKRFFKRKKLV